MHRSPDPNRDCEVLTGYPWLPLFAGYKGKSAVVITLVLLPMIASSSLFFRVTMTEESVVRYPIPLLFTIIAIVAAVAVACKISPLRAQVSKESQGRE